jgi:hypothetical protein
VSTVLCRSLVLDTDRASLNIGEISCSFRLSCYIINSSIIARLFYCLGSRFIFMDEYLHSARKQEARIVYKKTRQRFKRLVYKTFLNNVTSRRSIVRIACMQQRRIYRSAIPCKFAECSIYIPNSSYPF